MLQTLTSTSASVPTKRYDKFRIVLIKPSKYDDDGYVIRFWKGVLPSNTLNVLHGLTDDVKQRGALGDIELDVVTFDETAEKLPVNKIIRWSRPARTKLLVCLVGVQTNQFPRALELAKQFRAHNIDVMIGGFHTSGTVSMLGDQEPDIQELFREGITVISGEVEGKWEGILSDCLNGELKPLYHYAQDLQNLVDIGESPLPVTSPKTMKHFAQPAFGTADTSRGCPFACSFCTIINVQGRKMRERSPESIAELLRRNYVEHGVTFYFFTDDNFARKKLWRETFIEIIKLRNEGIKVSFMMQVDLAKKPKDFVPLAAEAGCTQVFIGMESVNPENLKAEGKAQNKVEEYQNIIKEWHDAGIVVHTGYIIGLPWDDNAGVKRDIEYLMNTIEPDQASFFMLTPLPGSQDHKEMKQRGEWMDPDFNKRDSFHATIHHPRMDAQEWTDSYEEAWRTFYSKENMIRVLSRWNHNPRVYWNLISVYFWYKNAAIIEKQHPMIAGFFRLKDRKARRSGYAVDPLPVHIWKRSGEIFRLLVAWAKFLKEMEEVWLQTRKKSEREERSFQEIQRIQGEIWQSLKIAEWQKLYNNAKVMLPEKAKALLDPVEEHCSKVIASRKDLNAFLRRWAGLQKRLTKLRAYLPDSDATRPVIEEMSHLHKSAWPAHKFHEWREAYSRLRDVLPPKAHLMHVKFDPVTLRAVYSRQDRQRFWANTVQHVKSLRLHHIRPLKLIANFAKDFDLTTSFASAFKSAGRVLGKYLADEVPQGHGNP